MPGSWTRRAALVAAAAPLVPSFAVAQSLPTIVVGGVVADDTVPVWYGMSNGSFRKAGVNVEFKRIASGTAATLGVVAGSFNIANTNALSVVNAYVRNIGLQIVANSGLYNGTTEYAAAVVKRDSTLQTAADINGKVLATTGVKDLHTLAVMSWMDQHGGDSKTLRGVEVPFSSIAAALEEGRVDVGMLLQPFLTAALASNKVHIFANAYSGIASRLVTSVWVANAAWAEQNADAVQRWARVMREGMAYANEHKFETAAVLAEQSGTDVEAIRRGGRETFTAAFAEPRVLQPVVDVAAEYGVIEKRFNAIDLISPAVRGLRG
jgi:NitT/TauT family transport system substrate-binding protein